MTEIEQQAVEIISDSGEGAQKCGQIMGLVITHRPADGAVDVDPSLAISVTVSRYLDPAFHVEIFEKALDAVAPFVEVKSRTVRSRPLEKTT